MRRILDLILIAALIYGIYFGYTKWKEYVTANTAFKQCCAECMKIPAPIGLVTGSGRNERLECKNKCATKYKKDECPMSTEIF